MPFESNTYSKVQIAEIQLNQALTLFLHKKDYISSVTLAGASEEILGKLLEQKGEVGALKEFTQSCLDIGEQAHKETWNEKDFVTIANYFRNHMKHFIDGGSVTINKQAASEIIERAVSNYYKLTGNETDLMSEFNSVMFDI